MNRTRAYAPVQLALHWVIVLLVVVMAGLGLWIVQAPPADDAFTDRLYGLHESCGLTLLAIMLVRVAMRLTYGVPSLPPATPRWVRLLAGANHVALYVVLLVQPVIGYLDTNVWDVDVSWFGLFSIPRLLASDEAARPTFDALHKFTALALALLIALHVLGVLYHWLVRRDGVARRMLGGAA